MIRRADTLTLDLFDVPAPRPSYPGSLNFNLPIRHVLSDILKSSPKSRSEVASQMAELTGDHISIHSINAWTAESRDVHRFPLEYLAAFEVASETTALTAWIASVRGGKVLMGKEALDAEIGKLERLRDEATKQIKQLKRAMGEAE